MINPIDYVTKCFECTETIDSGIYKAKITIGLLVTNELGVADNIWIHFHVDCFNGLAGDEWFVMLKSKWKKRYQKEFSEKVEPKAEPFGPSTINKI